MILEKSKGKKTLRGCSLEAGRSSGGCGSLAVSPGMPLTTVFGFLLSLASFILFVANIYNSARARPAKGTFLLSVCLVKPRFTRVAGIVYLFIAVVS